MTKREQKFTKLNLESNFVEATRRQTRMRLFELSLRSRFISCAEFNFCLDKIFRFTDSTDYT